MTRPSLLKLDLFYKLVSLNLVIFDRSEGDFRKENYVSTAHLMDVRF